MIDTRVGTLFAWCEKHKSPTVVVEDALLINGCQDCIFDQCEMNHISFFNHCHLKLHTSSVRDTSSTYLYMDPTISQNTFKSMCS